MAMPGVMTKFKISELSGVDRPAQGGARAVFMKREGDEDPPVLCPIMKREFTGAQRKTLAANGKALPDGSFPVENEADLHNAISAFGRAGDKPAAKAHIITRAKAMGMQGALPDGWVSKSSNQEHPMDKELRKSLGLAETATDGEVITALAKAKADAEAKLSAAEQAKMDAEKKAKKDAMSDVEKAFTKSMSEAEVDAFLAKSAGDRAALLATDETLIVKGITIRKSEAGAGVFELLKAQQAEIQENGSAIAKANEEARTARFEKQAESEFAHVSGTLGERVALLKSFDAMPEAVKKTALDGLRAQEAMAKAGFSRIGTGGGTVDGTGFQKAAPSNNGIPFSKADGELDRLAKEREVAKKISYAKAYDEVLQENPHLYEAENRSTK